jgi:hypothetical protein
MIEYIQVAGLLFFYVDKLIALFCLNQWSTDCYTCFLHFVCVSGIEIAYQEAVALKRQEELIREEEAAGLLENQMKGKRGGGGNEKDKRSKKKQVKYFKFINFLLSFLCSMPCCSYVAMLQQKQHSSCLT